jgi:uncharacterized protein with FMN-binding domain
VRGTTKSILAVVSVGLVAASYKFGIESYAAQNSQLSSLGGPVVPTDNGGNPAPQPDTSGANNAPAPTPTDTKSTATAPAATPKPKPTTSGSKPAATQPATTQTTDPAAPPPVSSPAVVTKTGGAIRYNFGTYQVSVTKTDGSITAVNLIQASYTRVPNGTNTWLVQSAIASQGSSFGNISRATYTTMAFKDALDSALAKF